MDQIRLDGVILVRWQNELIHLCRCEPISNLDEFDICHSPYGKNHIMLNGKTLCGKLTAGWQCDKVVNWTNRCSVCERLLKK